MKRILFLALATMNLAAADWPQFRGPESTGTADSEIPAKPKIDWTAALPGRGLASPIVVGDRVFVTCSSGPAQERLHVICFSTSGDGADDDASENFHRSLYAVQRWEKCVCDLEQQ